MFDLDGTLVDTSLLYMAGVPLVVQKHLGQPIEIGDYTDLWGHDVRTWFARAAGNGQAAVVDAMYADFETFYIRNHSGCPVYYGVGDGLALLKDRGCRIGIVTTRPQRRAELVRDFSWSSRLDFIVGGDRVARRKPFPDSLDFAISRYRGVCTDARNVYVGDNALDVEAAKASRHSVLSVGGLWGSRHKAQLIAATPDKLFDQFGECAEWLSTLRGEHTTAPLGHMTFEAREASNAVR